MPGIEDILDADELEATERAELPTRVSPMLATLVHDPFSDEDWIYERKLDGVRLLAWLESGEARLRTRNHKDRDPTYPELIEALESTGAPNLLVDGEVVAFEGSRTSFSKLQNRTGIQDPDEARATGVRVCYYLFDVLRYDGRDVTALPLRARKRILRRAFAYDDPLRFLPHRNREGVAYFREACKKGWEGLIAKKADSAYVHSRSRDWLKFKCVHRQELVVGGFTDPQGERIGFGALMVGYYDGDELRYAGKVGTGYDDETLERLRSRLDRLARKTPPFAGEELPSGDDVHWVTPNLVAEIGFTEWTDDLKLRHPRFLGLRDDKAPEDVVRETPDESP